MGGIRYGESHAVVVGFSEFKHICDDLPFVPFDVVRVALALHHHGFDLKIVRPHGPKTHREMDEMFRDLRREPPDQRETARLVFFVGGHGSSDRGQLILEGGHSGDKEAIFPLESLYRHLYELQGGQGTPSYRHILVAVDSCFSGNIFRSEIKRDDFVALWRQQPTWSLECVTAASIHEEAIDRAGGLLTEQLVVALRGEQTGAEDFFTVKHWADVELPRTLSVDQTPQRSWAGHRRRGEGERKELIPPDRSTMEFESPWADVRDLPGTPPSDDDKLRELLTRCHRCLRGSEHKIPRNLHDAILGLPLDVFTGVERMIQEHVSPTDSFLAALKRVYDHELGCLETALLGNAKETQQNAVQGQMCWQAVKREIQSLNLEKKQLRRITATVSALRRRLEDVKGQLFCPWGEPPEDAGSNIELLVGRALSDPRKCGPTTNLVAEEVYRYLRKVGHGFRSGTSVRLDKLENLKKELKKSLKGKKGGEDFIEIDHVKIMKEPVSAEQYKYWGTPTTGGNMPRTGVSLEEAADFCRLALGRLLTPDEWKAMFHRQKENEHLGSVMHVLEWAAQQEDWNYYSPGRFVLDKPTVCGEISPPSRTPDPVEVYSPDGAGSEVVGFRVAWDKEKTT